MQRRRNIASREVAAQPARVPRARKHSTSSEPQCQFILANGRRCLRRAEHEGPCEGKWCWQHCPKALAGEYRAEPRHAPRRQIYPEPTREPARRKIPSTSAPSRIRRTVPPSDLKDFRQIATRKTIDGYDVLVIPKGTILWHGTSSTFPDGAVPRGLSYFGNLADAKWYAFSAEMRRGAGGKIISVKTTRPITLIDITERSLGTLAHRENFDTEEFNYAFGYGKEKLRRISHSAYDTPISRWICDQQGLYDGGRGHTKLRDSILKFCCVTLRATW